MSPAHPAVVGVVGWLEVQEVGLQVLQREGAGAARLQVRCGRAAAAGCRMHDGQLEPQPVLDGGQQLWAVLHACTRARCGGLCWSTLR